MSESDGHYPMRAKLKSKLKIISFTIRGRLVAKATRIHVGKSLLKGIMLDDHACASNNDVGQGTIPSLDCR